jgi:hypothetical protein
VLQPQTLLENWLPPLNGLQPKAGVSGQIIFRSDTNDRYCESAP